MASRVRRTYNGFSGIDMHIGPIKVQAVDFYANKMRTCEQTITGTMILENDQDLDKIPERFTITLLGWQPAPTYREMKMELTGCFVTGKRKGFIGFGGQKMKAWRPTGSKQ